MLQCLYDGVFSYLAPILKYILFSMKISLFDAFYPAFSNEKRLEGKVNRQVRQRNCALCAFCIPPLQANSPEFFRETVEQHPGVSLENELVLQAFREKLFYSRSNTWRGINLGLWICCDQMKLSIKIFTIIKWMLSHENIQRWGKLPPELPPISNVIHQFF